MAKIKVVAASAPDNIAYRIDNQFFTRSPYGDDQPIPWAGDSPDLMIAALVTKWGMHPVIGINGEEQPEMEQNEVPVLGELTDREGEQVWKVEEVISLEDETASSS